MNKKGIEFGFAWLFAIIVGAVVIFIAIFATTNLIETSRVKSDTEIAAQIGTLLNPIETNLEESKYAVINFPDETRFFNGCKETGNFGRQIISTSVKSGIGKEFQEPGVENSFFNKYIFSKEMEQGEKLHVFVKPLEMPYKIADLVFASAGDYCFINPPNDIEDEITSLSPENMQIVNSENECSPESEVVCFTNGCVGDINVNLESQVVVKDDKVMYYEESLIYGAIFSDPEIYECQVKRLMKRTGELAHIYADKTNFLSGKGCPSNLASDLLNFASIVQQINDSQELSVVIPVSENIRRRNENLACKLF